MFYKTVLLRVSTKPTLQMSTPCCGNACGCFSPLFLSYCGWEFWKLPVSEKEMKRLWDEKK